MKTRSLLALRPITNCGLQSVKQEVGLSDFRPYSFLGEMSCMVASEPFPRLVTSELLTFRGVDSRTI